jgi:hypothetical protein
MRTLEARTADEVPGVMTMRHSKVTPQRGSGSFQGLPSIAISRSHSLIVHVAIKIGVTNTLHCMMHYPWRIET